MRQILVCLIVCLLVVQIGLLGLPSGEPLSDCDQAEFAANPCQDAAPPRRGVAPIADLALKLHVSEQSTQLIEQGLVTDMQILVKQLEFDRCQLELPEAPPIATDPVSLFKKARESVVVVGGIYKCTKCTKWHTSAATGFVMTASGAIATNYHVVDSTTKRTLVVMTADRHVYPVERVLAASRAHDLAILQIDAEGLTPLPIAGGEAAPVGAAVNVISHPADQFYYCSKGIVARRTRVRAGDDEIDAMYITADYARGSSGAPVFDEHGRVVGVVSSTRSIYYSEVARQQRNLQMVVHMCIPAESLLELIESSS
jgi:S1-C subfamily serine protease